MKKRVRVVHTLFATEQSPYDHGRSVEEALNQMHGADRASVEIAHAVTTDALVTIITHDEASI